jgi:hypothetical protein
MIIMQYTEIEETVPEQVVPTHTQKKYGYHCTICGFETSDVSISKRHEQEEKEKSVASIPVNSFSVGSLIFYHFKTFLDLEKYCKITGYNEHTWLYNKDFLVNNGWYLVQDVEVSDDPDYDRGDTHIEKTLVPLMSYYEELKKRVVFYKNLITIQTKEIETLDGLMGQLKITVPE